MKLTLNLPIELGHEWRQKTVRNFHAILNEYNELNHQMVKHKNTESSAHNAAQIDFLNTNVSNYLKRLNKRVNNLVVGATGDTNQEIRDSRISSDGEKHELLSQRLDHDFDKIDKQLDKETSVVSSVDFVWEPPYIPSSKLGENGTPLNWEPERHLDAFFNPLVDNKYVTKKNIGKDETNEYNMYAYTFEPEHYTKTILVTCCIHGNETTGFFSMANILNMLVNEWHKYAQLAYVRKNVRLIVVPMVNPWGFANQIRENVNNVDLNRNFDYNWENIKTVDPSKANYKGEKPFSEAESQNIRDLVQSIDNLNAHLDTHDIISVANDYCLFYPRWSKQANNEMAQLINELSDKGDYIVWGSSYLSSLSNWVGIENNTTSYLSELYEGRTGDKKSSTEMKRSVRWVGNLIFKLASIENNAKAQTSNDPIIKSFVYDDKFSGKDAEVITLRSNKNEWQRILLAQQRFKVLANGFVEMHGFITINVDREITVGVKPTIAQNYHPFFGSGKSSDRELYAMEHKLTKGNHMIPLFSVAGVQMSTETPPGSKRSNHVIPMLDLKKMDEGIVTIKQVKFLVKFTPSNNAGSVQIMTSGEHGNLKEDTFTQIYPNGDYEAEENGINEK